MTQNNKHQKSMMREPLERTWSDQKLLIITILLTTWSWFSRSNEKYERIINDSLRSYERCLEDENTVEQCINYFKVEVLHGARKVFKQQYSKEIQSCFDNQEKRLLKLGRSDVRKALNSFNTCFVNKKQDVVSNGNIKLKYIIIAFIFGILGFSILRAIVIFSSWKSSNGRLERKCDKFTAKTNDSIKQIGEKLNIMTEQLNRTNQKIFELEYDNELWKKVQELEEIQTRLQLLLDQIKKDSSWELAKINTSIKPLLENKNLEKSPLVIQEKNTGLLFDMKTQKGITNWKKYVGKIEDHEGPPTKIPELTPLSFSPISPDLSKVNLFDKNGKPFRRVFLPGTGWITRNKCIQIMKEASISLRADENTNSITY